jgi:hypothetical protein
MKKRNQKYINDVIERINYVDRHIKNVKDNCFLLGIEIIKRGEIELGHKLIANGIIHDASKFSGIEFEYLSKEIPTEENAKLKMKMAIHHHQKTNPHHIEYWSGGIKEIPKVYLCECICDWKSRSEEFGTNLREWIDEEALKRWDFTKDDDVYKEIMEFVDILCPKPFENINQT